ncbi:hypothetical protein NLI96_g3304 [Meripilus lineatus]|uniref:Uncharacterized protein n=1 Tax=Meripilus lineatus TaxID=2056292 RepID=A0AAD5V777_9APHY|nr:hypothetical protein NLI96_g3304 [Physisporinus lineatus]
MFPPTPWSLSVDELDRDLLVSSPSPSLRFVPTSKGATTFLCPSAYYMCSVFDRLSFLVPLLVLPRASPEEPPHWILVVLPRRIRSQSASTGGRTSFVQVLFVGNVGSSGVAKSKSQWVLVDPVTDLPSLHRVPPLANVDGHRSFK